MTSVVYMYRSRRNKPNCLITNFFLKYHRELGKMKTIKTVTCVITRYPFSPPPSPLPHTCKKINK